MPQSVMVSATRSIICLTRVLALRGAHGAAEVLGGDHVGGQGGPALGELQVALLEDDLAVLVGDGRFAGVPLDGVVGMDALAGEAPLDGQALPGALLARLELCVARLALRNPRGGVGPVAVAVPVSVVALAIAVPVSVVAVAMDPLPLWPLVLAAAAVLGVAERAIFVMPSASGSHPAPGLLNPSFTGCSCVPPLASPRVVTPRGAQNAIAAGMLGGPGALACADGYAARHSRPSPGRSTLKSGAVV